MNVHGCKCLMISTERYDELLRKEATLDMIKGLYDRISEYAFRDAIGHLLKSEKVKSDENA